MRASERWLRSNEAMGGDFDPFGGTRATSFGVGTRSPAQSVSVLGVGWCGGGGGCCLPSACVRAAAGDPPTTLQTLDFGKESAGGAPPGSMGHADGDTGIFFPTCSGEGKGGFGAAGGGGDLVVGQDGASLAAAAAAGAGEAAGAGAAAVLGTVNPFGTNSTASRLNFELIGQHSRGRSTPPPRSQGLFW